MGAGGALPAEPDPLDDGVRVVGPRVERREVVHHLGDGERVELAAGLQHHADPGPPVGAGGGRVAAEHGDGAGVTGAVALENLDRGGLAGAVRTEKGEDLAGRHGEVDTGHGDRVSVGFAQATDLDGVHVTPPYPARL
ncbi:hypothetical protein GCM10009558_042960 [Virgisporangium aurantiacum]